MSLVPLNNHSTHVPRLDHFRLYDILISQVKSFYSMEQVDLFQLFFFLAQLLMSVIVFWRPVFQLEHFAWSKEADNSLPMLFWELLSWVINFKRHFLITNLLGEDFLILVLFLLSGELDWIRLNERAISQKVNSIFEADISRILCRPRYYDNWPSELTATSVILILCSMWPLDLLQERPFLHGFVDVDVG